MWNKIRRGGNTGASFLERRDACEGNIYLSVLEGLPLVVGQEEERRQVCVSGGCLYALEVQREAHREGKQLSKPRPLISARWGCR